MKRSNTILMVFGLVLAMLVPVSKAQELDFAVLDATPLGSWQLREELVTDHKGRQTVNVMKSSLVGKEERDGEMHYWLEMTTETFKIKRGKRKPDGERVIVKSLVAASALKADPANIVNNLHGFGKDIIVKSGDAEPMRLTGAGMMAQSMMKAMGTKINYNFENLGSESVTVKAGTFTANKIQGSGSTTMKVLFKKVTVESDSTAWMSDKVPFGLVKGEGTTITNGKTSTQQIELIEYGTSGAESEITTTPQEMPQMPDLKGMFGG